MLIKFIYLSNLFALNENNKWLDNVRKLQKKVDIESTFVDFELNKIKDSINKI